MKDSFKKKKICLITCYWVPDYVRASTLREATQRAYPDDEVIIIKNHFQGILRYPEVFYKVLLTRIKNRPDVYLLTFRGYEVLLPIRILTIGRPLIFDEFINAEEWLLENKSSYKNTILHKIIHVTYRFLVKLPNLLITDTDSHAQYSSKLSSIPRGKIVSIPVGADEDIFKPGVKNNKKQGIEVFYYGGYMLPLHGLEFLLEAAVKLKDENIYFTIIGGGVEQERSAKRLVAKGAKINYKQRVPYEQLAQYTQEADVCLGGPFGGTLQSQFVITGKTYQFMAMAKPVIIGKNIETDNVAYFKDKKNCLVVEQASASSIEKALLWCLDNKSQLTKMGSAARKTYLEHMSVDCVSNKLKKEVYSKFI